VSVPEDRIKRIAPARVQEVAKALSGDLRLRILEALGDRTMSISQLMAALGAAQPTVSINVQILEQAGLVVTSSGNNREKLCSRAADALHIDLPRHPGETFHEMEQVSMPVGLFTDCSIALPCGLAGKEGLIGCPDDPGAFYLPERAEAQLLWFSEAGYVEYRFPNPLPEGAELEALVVSAEMCSEALGFEEEWPSDVTLFINGRRIGTVTCPGDYGRERGRLTPAWWLYGTQYGDLHTWRVEADGSRADGVPSAGTGLPDLELRGQRPITVRFEVEATAGNRRGLNLFGASFGNYPQDILLSFVRRKEPQ